MCLSAWREFTWKDPKLSFIYSVYHIWQERNNRIFRGEARNSRTLAQLIILCIQGKVGLHLQVMDTSRNRAIERLPNLDLNSLFGEQSNCTLKTKPRRRVNTIWVRSDSRGHTLYNKRLNYGMVRNKMLNIYTNGLSFPERVY